MLVVPMKLPAWMASIATGFITATLQLGASATLASPLSVLTVRLSAASAVTLPRTTVGAAGAGAWAKAAVAARASAVVAAAIFNMAGSRMRGWRRRGLDLARRS